MNARRWFTIIAAFLISGAFLYLALHKVQFSRVFQVIMKINPWWMLLSVVAQGGAFLAMAGRSKIMLSPLRNLPFYRLFKSALVSFAGNNILPLRMGEVLRVDYLARYGELPHSSCLAVVVVERLLDVFWLLLLFFIVLPLVMTNAPSGVALLIPGLVLSLAISGMLALSLFPEPFLKIFAWFLRPFGGTISGFANEKMTLFVRGLAALGSFRSILSVLFLTGCSWFAYILAVLLWMLAFGFHILPWNPPLSLCVDPASGCASYSMLLLMIPWFAPLFVQIFLSFGAALPSSPGFVGTYHYFATLALINLGFGYNVAASFAIVGHAVSVVPFTIIALFLLFRDFSWLTKAAGENFSGEQDETEKSQ